MDLLDTGHLDHPFKVWGEDSVLDKPAGQLVPLARVAAIDRQTRLGILVLGLFKITGYFLVHILGEICLIQHEIQTNEDNLHDDDSW